MSKNLFRQFHVTRSPCPRHSSNNWQWPNWPNAQQHRSSKLWRPGGGGRLLLSMTSQHGTKTTKPLGPSAHHCARALYDTNRKYDAEPSATGNSERITFCLWGQRERNWRKTHQGRGGGAGPEDRVVAAQVWGLTGVQSLSTHRKGRRVWHSACSPCTCWGRKRASCGQAG